MRCTPMEGQRRSVLPSRAVALKALVMCLGAEAEARSAEAARPRGTPIATLSSIVISARFERRGHLACSSRAKHAVQRD